MAIKTAYFILLAATTLISQNAPTLSTLKGRVTDNYEGAPVRQAYVLVHSSGSHSPDIVLPVQPDGRFDVRLPVGYYDVLVTAVGFDPTCAKLQIAPEKSTEYNPRIQMSVLESSQSARSGGPR